MTAWVYFLFCIWVHPKRKFPICDTYYCSTVVPLILAIRVLVKVACMLGSIIKSALIFVSSGVEYRCRSESAEFPGIDGWLSVIEWEGVAGCRLGIFRGHVISPS